MNEGLPDLPNPALVQSALTFVWNDSAEAVWRTEPHRQGVAPAPMPLTYLVKVFRGATQVGVARRKVAVSRVDGLHVKHVAFEVTDQTARAFGFPTAYWLASLDRYPSLGVQRVTFLADDDGRTFWARDPVRFRDSRQPLQLLASWTKRPPLSAADVEFMSKVEATPEAFTPADLYANPIGRLLLAQRSWQAVVDL
jgi:hypothetical protein